MHKDQADAMSLTLHEMALAVAHVQDLLSQDDEETNDSGGLIHRPRVDAASAILHLVAAQADRLSLDLDSPGFCAADASGKVIALHR